MVFHRCHAQTTTTAGLLTAAFIALALGGCGEEGSGKKPVTQLAAKVNDDEISIHQINTVLTKVGGVPPEMVPKVRREVLDRLVDQQLAVEQALKKNLDRTPEVIQAMEAAKREVLAQAYLDQVAGALPKPSAEEISRYYSNNPQLFAKRRIYSLQELAFPAKPELVKPLQDMIAEGKSFDDAANWLRSKEVKFSASAGVRTAEQVPLDVLEQLYEIRDGRVGVVNTAATTYVIKVVASQSAPLDEAAATPRIRLFLANQRAGEAIKKEIGQLRTQAKIEYLGEFSAPLAAAPSVLSAPAAQAGTGVKVATTAEPAKDGQTKTDKGAHEATVAKGVAGLK